MPFSLFCCCNGDDSIETTNKRVNGQRNHQETGRESARAPLLAGKHSSPDYTNLSAKMTNDAQLFKAQPEHQATPTKPKAAPKTPQSSTHSSPGSQSSSPYRVGGLGYLSDYSDASANSTPERQRKEGPTHNQMALN